MKKIVYDPTNDRTKKVAKAEKVKPENPKPEKTEEKAAKSGTKRPKPNEMVGDHLEFDIPKGLNAYGFIHVPKKAIDFLPFAQGVKLHAKIDTEKQTLIIAKA